MKELLSLIVETAKKGLDHDNTELGPKLATGIALFGAALVINALAPGTHDERDETIGAA